MKGPSSTAQPLAGTRLRVRELLKTLQDRAPWADLRALTLAARAGTGHPKSWVGFRADGSMEVSPGRPGFRLRLLGAGFEHMRTKTRTVYVLRAPPPAPAAPTPPDPWRDCDKVQVTAIRGGRGASDVVFRTLRSSWSAGLGAVVHAILREQATSGTLVCSRKGEVLGTFRVRIVVDKLLK